MRSRRFPTQLSLPLGPGIDIRDVYAEAKGNGYDVKALRAIVRMRRQDAVKRAAAVAQGQTLFSGDEIREAVSRALADLTGRAKTKSPDA